MRGANEIIAIGPFSNRVARDGLNAALLVSSIGFSVAAFAESQVISISSNNTNYFPGESFKASILYETTDNKLATGVGIRVHYDSSQLSVDAITNVLYRSNVGTQIKQDTADYDNDPLTDKFVTAGWADTNRQWPEYSGQQVTLLDLMISTSDEFEGSQINVTLSSGDVSYNGLGGSLKLTSN
tara:strand:+ start:492 stop:1040 length:549 start_codon:yes stop_codon:yes gene_type:complete